MRWFLPARHPALLRTSLPVSKTVSRYVFTVFEAGQSGVQRHDLQNGVTDTIWHSPSAGAHVAFDPSFWTPWVTFITAEVSWCSAGFGLQHVSHEGIRFDRAGNVY